MEAAKKEGKLTLYSFAFTGDIGLGLSKAFEQRYGVSIEIITGRGNEQIEPYRLVPSCTSTWTILLHGWE